MPAPILVWLIELAANMESAAVLSSPKYQVYETPAGSEEEAVIFKVTALSSFSHKVVPEGEICGLEIFTPIISIVSD